MKKISLLILIVSCISYSQSTKPFDELDKSLFSEKEDGLMYYEDKLYTGEFIKDFNFLNGVKQTQYKYVDGLIISGSFFNEEGKITNEFSIIKREDYSNSEVENCISLWNYDCTKFKIKYTNYSYESNGLLSSVVSYDDSNKTHGDFYVDGNIHMSIDYSDGKYDGEFLTYYPNGNKKSFVKYKMDKIDGKYISYYENGNKKSELFYVNGKPVKNSLFGFYQNGQPKSENLCDNYFNQTEYYENGNLLYNCKTGLYYTQNGEKDGLIQRFDNEGNLIEIGNITKGKQNGLWKTFEENGEISSISNYSNGVLNGESIFYESVFDKNFNSIVRVISSKNFYKNGKEDGKQYYYDVFDEFHYTITTEVETYKNGVLKKTKISETPIQKILSPDSDLIDNIKLGLNYKNDVLYYNKQPFSGSIHHLNVDVNDSIFNKTTIDYSTIFVKGVLKKEKGFFDTGEVEYEGDFLNNKIHGDVMFYYKSGEIRGKHTYVDGLRQGEEIFYYKSGEIDYKVNYIDDKLEGICYGYYKSGRIHRKLFFENGKRLPKDIYYYETGEKLSDLKLDKFNNEIVTEIYYDKTGKELNGLFKIDFENGTTMINIHNYSHGKPNGQLVKWDEDGNQRMKLNYKDGVLDGKQIYYNIEDNSEKVEYYENGVFIEE